MLYVDTSFLTPLIRIESTTPRIEQFFAEDRDRFATSHWTRVEFSSVLGRDVRMGQLTAREAAMADARFEALLEGSFVLLLPTVADYGLAKHYIGNYATGLRAPDALHLAVAINHRSDKILTLDRRLLAAGTAWGLPMSAGIEL